MCYTICQFFSNNKSRFDNRRLNYQRSWKVQPTKSFSTRSQTFTWVTLNSCTCFRVFLCLPFCIHPNIFDVYEPLAKRSSYQVTSTLSIIRISLVTGTPVYFHIAYSMSMLLLLWLIFHLLKQ